MLVDICSSNVLDKLEELFDCAMNNPAGVADEFDLADMLEKVCLSGIKARQ